jgi:hypothetical protein
VPLLATVLAFYGVMRLLFPGGHFGAIALFWLGTAVVGGPVFGAVGSWWRTGPPVVAGLTSAVLGVAFIAEAVACADLIEIPGGLYIGQNEILCQHHLPNLAVQTVRCAGIHETADVSRTGDPNVAGGRADIQASGVCGVRFGHTACDPDRVVTSTQGFYMFPGIAGYTGQIWAASVSDSVVLPDSGKTVPAKTASVATPHLVIAP